MDLRQLECFVAVAEELHFGHAAERLHLAQPTVSEAVRRLERDLGGALFDRTTRNVRLTEFGVAFYDEASSAFRHVEDAYDSGRELAQRGVDQFLVGYAMDSPQTLLSLVPALQERCPRTTMTLHAMPTRTQIKALNRRRLHVGICWIPDLDCGLCSETIGSVCFVAVVPASHPIAQEGTVPLRRVASEPLIGWPRAVNAPLYDRFADAMDATGEGWALVATAIGIDNVAARVLAGHGIGVVPEPVASGHPIDGIAYIPTQDGPALERVFVWRRDETHRAVGVFKDLLTEAVEPTHTLRVEPRRASTAPPRRPTG